MSEQAWPRFLAPLLLFSCLFPGLSWGATPYPSLRPLHPTFVFQGKVAFEKAPSTSKEPPITKMRGLKPKGWFSNLYLVDWSLALGVGIGGSLLMELVAPPLRDWAPGDRSLSLLYKKQTSIPLPLSLGLSIGVPVLGMGLAQIGIRSGHDFHHGMLGLVEALALTAFTTQLLQVATGSLRPDFFERCRPNIETLRCTGNPTLVAEGRRSFPSMEASLAFAGGVYLSLYLAGHLNPWNGAGWFWKLPLVLTPLVGSVALSLLPLLDNRNHVGDVVLGGLLGSGFALLAYHLNFVPLWAKRKDKVRARHRLTWLPMISPSGAGMVVTGRW